jgi:3-deoxy-D-manno-octulosonate 8-phosphate phosphatase (KDO 8-P phosphatase)
LFTEATGGMTIFEGGNIPADTIERARKIKLILMDVDGVMTDGTLFYLPGPDGEIVEMKGFNSQDGLGLHLCFQAQILTGVISGRKAPGTVERCRLLNMKYVYQGFLDKVGCWEEVLQDAGLQAEQAIFIGDDLTDIPLIRRAGLGVAVANARPEVKRHANFVTQASGGDGAVREVVELVLKSQGLWESLLAKYEERAAAAK